MNIKSADTASFLQRGRRQHITWCSQMIFVWTPPQVENTAEGPSEGSHLRTVVLYRSLFNIQFYSCFFQPDFWNILVVHSFFTFYLNLVRKAFNISSVIRRCGNRASAIHSFCWTKALLKGRLLVGFGWTSESFVDFDSFILL